MELSIHDIQLLRKAIFGNTGLGSKINDYQFLLFLLAAAGTFYSTEHEAETSFHGTDDWFGHYLRLRTKSLVNRDYNFKEHDFEKDYVDARKNMRGNRDDDDDDDDDGDDDDDDDDGDDMFSGGNFGGDPLILATLLRMMNKR